ncbi:MAG: hypothetical protein KatS3mg050_2027 [Litorilinea sp.]|nr:MAG: hypothetical protein KatS3mg050_2027 [Litorilinea sp.]
MTISTASQSLTIPVAHVDDAGSVAALLDALRAIHGPAYDFAVGQWEGETQVHAPAGHIRYRFIVRAQEAAIALRPGDRVRGPAPEGPYQPLDEEYGEGYGQVIAPHREALWPGDSLCVAGDEAPVTLFGQGTYFDVIAEKTPYPAPRLALLRHLTDKPGGCAAYPGAFRREALPPVRPPADAEDRRGVNRVNQHTLDMRMDRRPTPIRHYHGVIPVGGGQVVPHSETAIVLSRRVYGLPEVEREDEGHILIYRRPAEDPGDTLVIPVRPGSIVVTPATPEGVAGHCFENAFAMLVAIPGFVAPYNMIACTGMDAEKR